MRFRRSIVGFLAVLLLVCAFHSTTVNAEDCMPMYVTASTCKISLVFNNNSATCILSVTGKNGTTSISGKLKLYDATDKKTVKLWTISKLGVSYSGSKTAAVKPGHTYKLRFTGKVFDAGGTGESISAKVKKVN